MMNETTPADIRRILVDGLRANADDADAYLGRLRQEADRLRAAGADNTIEALHLGQHIAGQTEEADHAWVLYATARREHHRLCAAEADAARLAQ